MGDGTTSGSPNRGSWAKQKSRLCLGENCYKSTFEERNYWNNPEKELCFQIVCDQDNKERNMATLHGLLVCTKY